MSPTELRRSSSGLNPHKKRSQFELDQSTYVSGTRLGKYEQLQQHWIWDLIEVLGVPNIVETTSSNIKGNRGGN